MNFRGNSVHAAAVEASMKKAVIASLPLSGDNISVKGQLLIYDSKDRESLSLRDIDIIRC